MTSLRAIAISITAVMAAAAVASCQRESPGHDGGPFPKPTGSEPATAAALAFGPRVRSLRLRRSIVVRRHPDAAAAEIGTVARDIRVGFRGSAVGPGCESRWIEIAPRGFVCEFYLEPSEKEPWSVELPRLARGELVPGEYAKVAPNTPIHRREENAETLVEVRRTHGSVTVHKRRLEVEGGVEYWRTDAGDWVPTAALSIHQPSRHHGVRLGDETGVSLPLVFAIIAASPGRRVPTFQSPTEQKPARPMLPRTAAPLLDTQIASDGALWYRIGEERWLRQSDARLIRASESPESVGAMERWVDIDLSRQTLVAYEGTMPVFATLVSSGRGAHATETGIYRIWIKFASTTMTGEMADESSYSVATVPWTQFYAKDLALHSAYWHDLFGIPRSHGCINLSPRDARFLYFWTEPSVPSGWSMAHGDIHAPGSIVRVRSDEDPQPRWRGYAADVVSKMRERAH